MKKVFSKIFSICILLIIILLPNNVKANSSGYIIEEYDINMVVNENNTFDITEIIKVNFTATGKHGIFRKIPLRNSITRLDGTKSNNRAIIKNIQVNEESSTYYESGYNVIKIGNADKTVFGEKEYVIKYNYDIGADPLKNNDELYFNLIGTEWDTTIENVNFKITMPKNFDESQLGFSSGYEGSTNNLNIYYNVQDTIIVGELYDRLFPGEGLTVRLTLPEGYFVGARSNFDYIGLIEIIASIVFVIISFMLWKKYGKDDRVIETVEFYPPDNLNSAEIGFLYKGYSENKDIISLLIYLANKGYIKIEETKEKAIGFIKTNNFKIIKLKEYDGNNLDERTFFEGLFESKDEITKEDLQYKFYKTLNEVSTHINRKENKYKIYEKSSLNKSLFIVFTIFMTVLFIINDIFSYNVYFIKLATEIISICINIFFLIIIKKRTKYGIEMLGKIKGFKAFLENAEKDKLEALVNENPEYFYNILPYTYVLGVSNKWIKKFENIAIEPPNWYYGYNNFDMYVFSRFMDSTYRSISNAMSSDPSSSSSGGGFSGGGSGGGGGGSW